MEKEIDDWNEIAEGLYENSNPFQLENKEDFYEEMGFTPNSHPNSKALAEKIFQYLIQTKNLYPNELLRVKEKFTQEKGNEENQSKESKTGKDDSAIDWGSDMEDLDQPRTESKEGEKTYIGDKINRWNELVRELYGESSPLSIESEEDFRKKVDFAQGNQPNKKTLLKGFYRYLIREKNLEVTDLENLVELSVEFNQKENE